MEELERRSLCSGVPASPWGMTAVATSDSTMDLEWTDTEGETGYQVERSATGTSGWAQIATVDANVSNYQDTSLSEGTPYYYRVRATSPYGSSAYGNVAAARTLLAAPGGFANALYLGSTDVAVSWEDDSSHETGYVVQASISGSGVWTPMGEVAAGVTTFDAAGPFYPSTSYSFRVLTTTAGLDAEASAPFTTDSLGVEGLTNLVATAAADEIDLSWANDLLANVSEYRIYHSTDGFNWQLLNSISAQGGTSTYDLPQGGTYFYRVEAWDGDVQVGSSTNVAFATAGAAAPAFMSDPVTHYTLGRPAAPTDDLFLSSIIRDFRSFDEDNGHPDFQYFNGDGHGIVEDDLGGDGTPTFASTQGVVTSEASFADWYHDRPEDYPGVGLTTPRSLLLTEESPGVYSVSSEAFFPDDGPAVPGRTYGTTPGAANDFGFTYQLHSRFTYEGGEEMTVKGDDDVWVFIDGQRVVDLGGVHSEETATVDFDSLGLTVGQTYDFDMFYAERHTYASDLKLSPGVALQSNGRYEYDAKAIGFFAGDPVTYSLDATSLASGMTIDPQLGIIRWLPDPSQAGTHSVTVTATNVGGSTTQTYDLVVENPLPAWLDSSSEATWDPATHHLTVTGPTTIVADPGSDAPIVDASGVAAQVAVQPFSDKVIQLAALNLSKGATTDVKSVGVGRTSANHIVLEANSACFTVDSLSKLDLEDNDMVLHNADVTAETALAHLVQSGINGGNGIFSSVALTAGDTTIGYGLNNDPVYFSHSTFGPASVNSTDLLVKYTYFGDANLDGQTTLDDYAYIDSVLPLNPSFWWQGDFNNDGETNNEDYGYIDLFVGNTSPVL